MTTKTASDVLQQFNVVREALKQEKQALEARLNEIGRALGEGQSVRSARQRNEITLKKAVIQAVSKRPMDRYEILDEVQKSGYKFTTANPLNSMGVILYGKNPRFKRDGKKFALGK